MSAKPNPNAPPFPFPKSTSPTSSTHTASSYSLEPASTKSTNSQPNSLSNSISRSSISSTASSTSSTSPFPSFPSFPSVSTSIPGQIKVNIPSSLDQNDGIIRSYSDRSGSSGNSEDKKIRKFGEGWKSGLIPSNGSFVNTPKTPPNDNENNSNLDSKTPQPPMRARSPSMPNLPTQSMFNGLMRDEPPLLESLNNLNISYMEHPGSEGYDYISRGMANEIGGVGRGWGHGAGIISSRYDGEGGGGISHHHKSVPDLDKSARRRPSVRFSDQMYGYDRHDMENDLREGGLNISNKRKTVYVHSLPNHLSSDDLKDFAREFGKVVSITFGREEGRTALDSFEPRRHAYIVYENTISAGSLIHALRSKGFSCEFAKEDWQSEYRSREDPYSSNVYVVGLPMEWNKDKVEDHMTRFGRVASLRLLEDRDGHRRGPVLVRFDSRPQAEKAIKLMDGQLDPITGSKIQARIADSDGQKDFKKLKSTTSSANLLSDDRDLIPDTSMGSDIRYLLRLQDKYHKKLEVINTQIANARSGYPTHSPGYSVSSSINEPLISPQPFRTRQFSGASAFTDSLITPNEPVFNFGGSINTHTPPTLSHRHSGLISPSRPQIGHSISFGSQGRSSLRNMSSVASMGSPLHINTFQPEGSLHHIRSSPDLGKKVDNSPAKLLWP